jgi:hypothetical protein
MTDEGTDRNFFGLLNVGLKDGQLELLQKKIYMNRKEIEALVRGVYESHFTHENPHGLLHPDESPNTNTIYKAWSDGEITYEKGGFAYGDRSMKQVALPLVYFSDKSVLPTFPIAHGGNTCAILTLDECRNVRGLLKAFFDPMLPKRIEVRIDSDEAFTERVNTAIRRVVAEGIKVTYRSPVPRPVIFVVESLMMSSADVMSKIETCLLETGLLEGTFSMSKVEC